jgi:hypothetical protein
VLSKNIYIITSLRKNPNRASSRTLFLPGIKFSFIQKSNRRKEHQTKIKIETNKTLQKPESRPYFVTRGYAILKAIQLRQFMVRFIF